MDISPHLKAALRQVQNVAPGRLGIHGRNKTIPHIVDAFQINDDKIVPVMSTISGKLSKSVTTAAQFEPDIIAWSGPAHVEGLNGSEQFMSVLAERRDPNRTVASSVPYVRDVTKRTLTMGNRSVSVEKAPPEVARELITSWETTSSPESTLDTAQRVGILVYGHGPYGYLSHKYSDRGWTRLKNGSFFNAVGPFEELMERLRGLSILTTPENFRDAMARGAQ